MFISPKSSNNETSIRVKEEIINEFEHFDVNLSVRLVQSLRLENIYSCNVWGVCVNFTGPRGSNLHRHGISTPSIIGHYMHACIKSEGHQRI